MRLNKQANSSVSLYLYRFFVVLPIKLNIFRILQGTPIPKIAWQFKCRGSNEFLTIPGTGEAMEIPIAILNNAGYYKCVAENVAGSDDKITGNFDFNSPVVF